MESKLIIFPRKRNKPKAGDSETAELEQAQQLTGPIMPMPDPFADEEEAMVITDDMKEEGASTRSAWRVPTTACSACARRIGSSKRRPRSKYDGCSFVGAAPSSCTSVWGRRRSFRRPVRTACT